eukprot:Em0019g582a
MQLQLFDKQSKFVCDLDNDDTVLGAYPVQDGFRIHAVDKDPTKKPGEFEDLSGVKKYEMSSEEYAKRGDTVMAFKKQLKLGRFAEKDDATKEEEEEKERQDKMEAEAITIGSRCEVLLPQEAPKRGTVMFVGKTDFKPGYWIGVKYDEPLGKNDGSVGGKRYFECPPKHGAFVQAKNVKVGDYPEETYSDDEI